MRFRLVPLLIALLAVPGVLAKDPHGGGLDPSGLLDLEEWRRAWPGEEWREELRRGEEEAEVRAVRECTRRGRPLGSDSFLSKVEKMLGRRVRARPAGRPSRGQRDREWEEK